MAEKTITDALADALDLIERLRGGDEKLTSEEYYARRDAIRAAIATPQQEQTRYGETVRIERHGHDHIWHTLTGHVLAFGAPQHTIKLERCGYEDCGAVRVQRDEDPPQTYLPASFTNACLDQPDPPVVPGRVEKEADCYSCGEPGAGACPKSKRPCGHHCNCSWVHDHCHWCDKEFGEQVEEDGWPEVWVALENGDVAEITWGDEKPPPNSRRYAPALQQEGAT